MMMVQPTRVSIGVWIPSETEIVNALNAGLVRRATRAWLESRFEPADPAAQGKKE
jgi:hypothetical protein